MNTTFIFAHPDDEAYGPAGTIATLASDKSSSVAVASLCMGDRPGAEHVATERQQAFKRSCEMLGAASIICDGNDGSLELQQAITLVGDVIRITQPSVIYTHNISDLHRDHRIVAEAVMVAARPKAGSRITELYMCESSVTDWTFGQIDPVFVPNTFHDVSDQMGLKAKALDLYATETYDFPDARSVKAMKVLAMNRGRTIGVRYAEAFHQVFRLA